MARLKKTWTIAGITLIRGLWITIILIPVLWFASLFLLYLDKERAGTFGDMFGAVNALFSGFAFVGIIISIRMQSEELELQRNELKDTREEFKNQNFQTTFFNLLKNQRDIINEFSFNITEVNARGDVKNNEFKGRGSFRQLKKELIKISEALKMEDFEKLDLEKIIDDMTWLDSGDSILDFNLRASYINNANRPLTLHIYNISEYKFNEFKNFRDEQIVEKLGFIYEIFFRRNEYAIGHYFRHFYHLLRFLDKSEQERIDEIKKESNRLGGDANEAEQIAKISEEFLGYVEFIKAQVDVPELILLFYNSLNYEKAKKLFIKYQIFDVLSVGNLISEEHNVVPEYKLYRTKS